MNPKKLNYQMPAEWQNHERTFLSWPVQESMCFPDDYTRVCQGYAGFIKVISEFEPVTVLVNPNEHNFVSTFVRQTHYPVDTLVLPHNDSWLRDNGPTFVRNERGYLAGINWHFNAWGEKYRPWNLDDEVASVLLDNLRIYRFDAPLVMEGGSFHVDGEGSLLTTEQCLLSKNRNPAMNRDQIEQNLQDYLSISKVIWLKNGLSGDETDGHVDNIACFAAPGKVLIQCCDDPEDDNYLITQENIARLEKAIDAQGRSLEIIRIPQPPPRFYQGTRLTLSYLNFYFVNQGIILPVFGEDAKKDDKQAAAILAETFPDRTIRTVDGMAIIREGGNVHCATQQMPKMKEAGEAKS
ncbi:agmatine deiminase family protein [Sporolactobacillus shoreicorticis]|uniref:Agmatine/peptidylarginine deiminase n=1 Tax=Sporolactobacillus shoreicorticis TaxID=1923877 RepID=A0ABW5S5T6_9BACL|nr:agmatine deiminase family protein [Sporolactobacillus shoreicorticis]MCO7125846.1 agmatine deiminase family protein [Sporolactobacillus shoreicorticis]